MRKFMAWKQLVAWTDEEQAKRARPPMPYAVDLSRFPEDSGLRESFRESNCDAETQAFLDAVRLPSKAAAAFSGMLQAFCSRTTANSIANRGSMFVLSRANAQRLLEPLVPLSASEISSDRRALRLLDIGAGDGGVTAKLDGIFKTISATEASKGMQWRLWRRGYTVVNNFFEEPPYDCVSLFNVLDRCDRPISLLHEMKRATKPGGVCLLAVVLPWCPFVEDGPKQRAPTELLPMHGCGCCDHPTFEHCVATMVRNVFTPAGFEVLRWTRVPYLCEGDHTTEYYALDDAVFVLRPKASA